MDGLHVTQRLVNAHGISKPTPAKPSPTGPAQPEGAGRPEGETPCPTAKKLDEVFGSTISLLKDLSRASMQVAQATGVAADKPAPPLPDPRPVAAQPPQIDTMA
jgi:hypothetical protein